jgi:hypothetical protein
MEITNDCDIDAMDGDNDTVNLEESTSETVDGDVRAYPTSEPNSPTMSEYCTSTSCKNSLQKKSEPTLVPLNSPIYHQSKLPIVSSLLSFVVKHSLTDAALHELLQLISYLPKLNICFTSPHTFKQ